MSSEANQAQTTGPYSIECIVAGCPTCHRGERWRVIGPTPIPEDLLGLTQEDAELEAARYNAIHSAAVTSSTEPTK